MDSETRPDPTLKDIAREAEVSVAAVSKVLNNRPGVGVEARERILDTARRLGYRGRGGKADAQDHGLTRAVAVTLDSYVVNDAFYGVILSGLVSAGADAGIEITVAVIPEASATAIGSLFPDGPPEALLLVGIDHPDLIDAVVGFHCPAVIVNGMDRTMRLSSVSPDYHFGAWLATRHLLDLGHRDILHVTHPFRESIRRRMDGFRNALEESGIEFDAERHILDLGSTDAMTMAAGQEILKHIDARGSMPDALFCVSDIVALGAIQALRTRGLSVPSDVSVSGFDGLPVGAHATPTLTSMETDREDLARIAIRQLTERAAHPDRGITRVTVGVALKTRQSTGPNSRHD